MTVVGVVADYMNGGGRYAGLGYKNLMVFLAAVT